MKQIAIAHEGGQSLRTIYVHIGPLYFTTLFGNNVAGLEVSTFTEVIVEQRKAAGLPTDFL